MPFPFIIAAAGITAATTAFGVYQHQKAKEILEQAQSIVKQNLELWYGQDQIKTIQSKRKLQSDMISIVNDFKRFADLVEQVHNRPEFGKMPNTSLLNKVKAIDPKAIEKVFPVSQSTTSFGLGGAIALGAANLMSLGVVSIFTGLTKVEEAEQALIKAQELEEKIKHNLEFTQELRDEMDRFTTNLSKTHAVYSDYLTKMETVIKRNSHYEKFSGEFEEEIDNYIFINAAFLTAILYDMCKVPVYKVLKSDDVDTSSENMLDIYNKHSDGSSTTGVVNHRGLDYVSRKTRFARMVSFSSKFNANFAMPAFYLFEAGRGICMGAWYTIKIVSKTIWSLGQLAYAKIKCR